MQATLIPTVKTTKEAPDQGVIEVVDQSLLDQEEQLWFTKARIVLALENTPESLKPFYLQEIEGRPGGLERFLEYVFRPSRSGGSHCICLFIDNAMTLGLDWSTDHVLDMRQAWGEVLNIYENSWKQDGNVIGDEFRFQANGIHTVLGKPIVDDDPWINL